MADQDGIHAEVNARIDSKLDHIIEKVDRVDIAIYGNGNDGLIVRTDRNTQAIGSLKKFVWIVITGIVGAAIIAAAALL